MKLPSKKIAITAFAIAALVLITLVGVFVAVRTTQRPTQRTKVTISADDLAEMKTLVHKYLNERNRVAGSHDPQSNPNVAGAPVIDPSEMSPELAARQKEDVKKLRNGIYGYPFTDDFATFTQLLDIPQQGPDVVLDIADTSFYHYIPANNDPTVQYPNEGGRRYYTFARKGTGWKLTDAKLAYEIIEPSLIEPRVKPNEKGTPRVLAETLEWPATVSKEIKRLDRAATEKIENKWAIDEKAVKAIEAARGERTSIIIPSH
jgi:hypothetical protein